MAVGAIIARILTQYSDKGTKAAVKDISKMEKNFGKFANKSLKYFGIAAAAAGVFAIKVGKDAVQAAMEDQKSQALLANSLRGTIGATDEAIAKVEEYISKLQLTVGVADDQLRPALGKLAAVTGDIAKAQSLLGIALDISAAKGIDLETASQLVSKAYAGNFTALKKLFPQISDSTVKSKDFAKALAEIQGEIGGAAAAAANTFAGRLERMKLAFGEIYETVGYALLPVLSKLFEYINAKVLPAIQAFVTTNKDQIAESFKKIIGYAIGFFNVMFDAFQFVSKNIKIFAALGAVIAAAIFGAKVAMAVSGLIKGVNAIIKVMKALRTVSLAAAAAEALATGGASAAAGAAAFALALGGIYVAMNKFENSSNSALDKMGDLDLSFEGLDVKASDYLKGVEGITKATNNLTAAQKEELKVQELLLKLKNQYKLGSKDLSAQSATTLEAIRKNQVKQAKLGLSAPSISLLASAGHGNIANKTTMNGGNVTVNIAGSVVSQGDLVNGIKVGLDTLLRRRTGGGEFGVL